MKTQSKDLALPTLTKQLSTLAQDNLLTLSKLRQTLKASRPSLERQIAEDAKHPERFLAWGTSTNIDAGAQTSTVHPNLLRLLCEWTGRPFDPETETTNAGLLHTYGYLLSNLKTSFGYKRARWCKGNLERGLELPKSYLSPNPKTGTLLGNLTDLCTIVFADYLDRKRPEGTVFDPSRFTGSTLTETIQDVPVTLVTRIVNFSKANDDAAALFYGAKIEDKFEFITLFPVSSWMIGKIRKSAGKAEAKIKTRYNAMIPELGTAAHPGKVSLESWPPA